jgi:hypothetical protein
MILTLSSSYPDFLAIIGSLFTPDPKGSEEPSPACWRAWRSQNYFTPLLPSRSRFKEARWGWVNKLIFKRFWI